MFVTKRNGNTQEIQFDKISDRINKLINKEEKQFINPIIISQKVISSIYDGITTEELDIESAKICANLCSTHPLYAILGGRILASNLQKKNTKFYKKTKEGHRIKTIKRTFSEKMRVIKEETGLLSDNFIDIVNNNAKRLDNMIDYSRDFMFDFFGFKTLERAYLIKNINTNEIYECPQDMWLRVAVNICQGNMKETKKLYDLLSNGYYTHASPTLFNSGSIRNQLASCFLVGTDDSMDGITDTWKSVSRISKYGGGIGLHISNIRSKNSIIRGTNGKSSGIIPMLKVYNEIARYVNQSGKRKGSIAIYLEPHHADIMEFLDLRKNFGDENMRARDLFLAVWLSDLFMKQVEQDKEWYLMCPDECPGLNDVWGDEYETLYWQYVNEGKFKKKIMAREVYNAIQDSRFETGTPYVLFKDSVNRKSNHQNIGTIKSSNLCVSGDTDIYTDKGIYKIKDLKDEEINIWNGYEFSKTKVIQTGVNQKMMKITFSNGEEIKCTPYHKFFIKGKNSDFKNSIKIDAQELEVGMKLPTYEYNNELIKDLQVSLIEESENEDTFCVNEPLRNSVVFNGILTGNCAEIVEYSDKDNHAVCNLASIALNKMCVPFDNRDTHYIVYTKPDCNYCYWSKTWLSNKGYEYQIILCDDEDKINELKKKVGREFITFPQIYAINNDEEYIGGFEELVKYHAHTYDYDKLYDVAYTATKNLDKVIDINFYPTPETKRSNFKTRPLGLGIQGLADTLVLMKIPFESEEALQLNKNIMETIYYASMNASCDMAKDRQKNMIAFIENYVGQDINLIPEIYDDKHVFSDTITNELYHKTRINQVDLINFSGDNYCCQGAYSLYHGSPVSQGILQYNMWGIEDDDTRHDWTGLKKKIKKYGVRNSLVVALMPTASTSQILGNNVAFEFFNSNIFTRKTLAGDFVVMNKYLVDDLLLLNEWSKEKKDLIVMNNGSVQNIEGIPRLFKYLYKTQFEIKQRWVLDHAIARSPYVCQTQSMNLFFDKPNNKFCYSSDMYAWKNGLKTGCYYLQTKPATNAVKVTIDPRLMRVTNNDEHEVCESCSA